MTTTKMKSGLHASPLAFIYTVLLVQQIIAASTHFIAKFATLGADPFTIVFLRGSMTLGFVVVWFAPQWKNLPRLERKDLPLLALLGLLNIPCNQVLFVSGLRYTTPPNASLAYALVPAFVLAIMVLFFKEKATLMKFLGIGIALSGAILILFERGVDIRSEFFCGNMLELSAALSWAWYSILGKRLAVKYGALYATSLTMISGMCWYIPIYALLPNTTPFAEINLMTLLYAGYLGIVVSIVGYFLWYFALTRLPASNVAVFSNLQSVMVTITAAVIFGQLPSTLFLIGGACVIAGVIITQRGT